MGIERERDFNCFINWVIAMKLQKYVCESQKYDYAFVRSSLLQEQILMFCPVNMMSLTENAGIKINLL